MEVRISVADLCSGGAKEGKSADNRRCLRTLRLSPCWPINTGDSKAKSLQVEWGINIVVGSYAELLKRSLFD